MTRIRYSKTENGNLVSKPLLAKDKMVVANIKPDGTYFICTDSGEVLTCSTETNTPPTAKKHIKKTLALMGVNFSPEVRPALGEVK